MEEADIHNEILMFYNKLLGSSTISLLGVDIITLRSGSTLSMQARSLLCREVSEKEDDIAIMGIGDDKSYGLDGFNSFFFKKCLPNIYKAIRLFSSSSMLWKFNCTSITLMKLCLKFLMPRKLSILGRLLVVR